MEIMGIGSVAVITVLCYLLGMTVRNAPLDNKWIPSIVGGVGLLLGFVGWRVIPDYPASDWLTALAVGVVSGLAATGIDQVYHQLNPREHNVETVRAYEHYDENGDPISDKDWAAWQAFLKQQGFNESDTPCEECDLSKYVDEGGGGNE